MKFRFRPTQDPSIDTFKVEYLVGPALLLSLVFNYAFSFTEIFWSFSIFLESVAILPQLFMLQRTGEAETITTHYLAALGAYRGLYIPNWIYRYFADDLIDPIAVIAGLVQTALYLDFFYVYFTKISASAGNAVSIFFFPPYVVDFLSRVTLEGVFEKTPIASRESGIFYPDWTALASDRSHSYTQNANIFSKRLSALRKTCVFVDAPIVLHPIDIANTFSAPSESSDSSNALAAYGAAEANTDDPALTPRAWWKTDLSRTETTGMEESVIFLRDLLRQQRFEGIFGFSQGAAMAAILSALLERPHLHPPFLVDGEAPHPPFKFCVSVSGFMPPGPLSEALFSTPYETPTLHVLGKNDILVVEERTRALVKVSKNNRVEEHDGGHFVPSKASWRNFFKAYLKDPTGDIPGPGGSAASEPPSGAVTPATRTMTPASTS
ncbi:hypothetical protein EW146_g2352 [Bondarzewia mesenterica]|uniref:ER lumen protein-retaining receptor n=1 Tax=Bondarzewia mesenterica TaxID=1095465 RepID=A0A4S4M0X8_9AGAM|nr:hypothetical protein EW146_g2352 [Bondarzewia mesenterica]